MSHFESSVGSKLWSKIWGSKKLLSLLLPKLHTAFFICPWAQWMSHVSAPPQQHTSVHTVYCTTLGNDPWKKQKRGQIGPSTERHWMTTKLVLNLITNFVFAPVSHSLTCSRSWKYVWVWICCLHRARCSSVRWGHWPARPQQVRLHGPQMYTPVHTLPLAGLLPMF